jgi:hypothetical protein
MLPPAFLSKIKQPFFHTDFHPCLYLQPFPIHVLGLAVTAKGFTDDPSVFHFSMERGTIAGIFFSPVCV